MSKIRHTLQLLHAGALSTRQIGAALGISKSTVSDIASYARAAGVDWALAQTLSDEELQARLYPPPVARQARHLEPDYAYLHRELRRAGVTLQLLWEEYQQQHQGQAYKYSAFCEKYHGWAAKLKRSMRQTHIGGDKLFVDYAGQTVAIIDASSGEITQAQIFVAALGASNFTYACATPTQKAADWIGAIIDTLEFIDGVPRLLVPDQPRALIARPDRYEPTSHRLLEELSAHYGLAVLPARPAKPRDKPKVEVAVQVVERWILARLRDQRFFSLAALNRAIGALVLDLNQRPFKKLPGCRASAFAELDRPALRALPATRMAIAHFKRARVNIDYHVELDGHYYSVPYQLVKHQLEVRLTAKTVECFHANQRVASHLRSPHKGRHTTQTEHMPKSHREHAEWTPQRLIHWAEQTGPNTAGVIAHILERRIHPQHGFRACLGILRLSKQHGEERLEAACQRALALGACSYKSLESILRQGLERLPLAQQNLPLLPEEHINLRGPGYYH